MVSLFTVGSQMLQELLSSSTGMEAVVNKKSYEPREIAAEVRNKKAHAVLWHAEKERFFCFRNAQRSRYNPSGSAVRRRRNANAPTADSAC